MAQNSSATDKPATKNRWASLLWVLGIAVVIITCLVLQQTALLYVLSTLGVSILLAIVGMADLTGSTESRSEL